jgi:hypothetical protein
VYVPRTIGVVTSMSRSQLLRRRIAGRVTAAVLATVAVLLSSVTPAGAVVDAADYVAWRFRPGAPQGVGFIREGASSSTLIAETVGLQPSAGYRFVGSSRRCADSHLSANVLWQRTFQSNGKGAAYVNTALPATALSPSLRSIRLFKGTSQVDCAVAAAYRRVTSGGSAIDLVAQLSPYNTRALLDLDMSSGNDVLTLAGHGFIASHGYRLVAASVACPTRPNATTTLFEKSGQTNALGVMWRHDVGANLTNATPRSIQLFSPSGRVACVTPTRLQRLQ